MPALKENTIKTSFRANERTLRQRNAVPRLRKVSSISAWRGSDQRQGLEAAEKTSGPFRPAADHDPLQEVHLPSNCTGMHRHEVTLRGDRMFEFVDKLMNAVLPDA